MNCKVCENTSAKNTSVSFFRFPKENSRCRDWAERCNLLNLYEKHGTLRFYKSFRICSDHFDPKDIIFDGRKKRLLQSAVPNILSKTKNDTFTHDEIFKLKLVENLCRLCAEENKNMTDIFGWRGTTMNLEDKLKYFPLVMTRCDILPLRVCHQCISKINQFYEFIMNCMKAETKLRIMLQLEDCDPTCKMIKSDDYKQEPDWDSGIKTEETPNLDSKPKIDNSPDVINNSPETIVDDYSEFHQVLQGNLSDLNESFEHAFEFETETNCTETNQCFKINHTNYIKEVDFSRNISFEHNYSNTPLRDQLTSSKEKIQTENDQNFSKGTKFQCDICLESFMSVEALHSHSLSHPPELNLHMEFICKICSKVFFSRRDFDEHIGTHAGENSHQICDLKFHEVAFLKKHSLGSNYDNFTDIRVCPNQEESSENSPNIAVVHPFKSSLRAFDPPSKKSKILKSPGSLKRRCHFCDSLFKDRQLCLMHEKSHTGETPYLCKLCGKTFRSRQSLRQHRPVHSDKRLFTCQQCGMSFKRKDTLGNHLRIHTGERPFVCKFCGFAFKQRGDCTKHEKNHDKPTEINPPEEDQHQEKKETFTSSTTKEIIADVSQIRDGTIWNEERTFSLPPFVTIAEEITPVDCIEDLVPCPMIFCNF